MSRKDKILHDAIERNNLLSRVPPDGFLWNLITGCMQTYVSEQEIATEVLTIREVTEIRQNARIKTSSTCEHVWLKCSNTFEMCDNCPEWRQY